MIPWIFLIDVRAVSVYTESDVVYLSQKLPRYWGGTYTEPCAEIEVFWIINSTNIYIQPMLNNGGLVHL